MSARRSSPGRATLRAGLVAGALAAAVIALLPGGHRAARAQDPQLPVAVRPQFSPAFGATLLGAAPGGTSGDPAEAWAYERLLGHRSSPPALDGAALPQAGGDGGQLVLLRYTSTDGWRFVATPQDEDGKPYWGGLPGTGRVTPRGGLALMSNDRTRKGAATHVLLVADRGKPLQVAPAPDATVLEPAQGSLPAETLALDALAATDDGDHTVAYAAIAGRPRQTGVARYTAGAWTREPLCADDETGTPPAGCAPGESLHGSASALATVALAAAGDHAWLLARPADGARGLTLFERTTAGGSPRWVLTPLGKPALDDAATTGAGVAAMGALASPDALTATPDGVWLDARFELRGTQTDLTAFFDGAKTTTWCDDAQLCDHPLGVRFGSGYRSFAWSATARVLTDVRAPGAALDAIRPEAYASLEGGVFVRHESFDPRQGQGAAFGAPDEGWIGAAHIGRTAAPATEAEWPIPVRRPLTAIAGAPDHGPGDIGGGALAVGLDGTVLRYAPGQGWDSEQLLGASGVARDSLRGVAWPTPEFAYAVGDEGAMWRWNSVTGLWEPDPGAPFDFVGHLTGIAFQPGNPDRGYAVGRAGVLLRYDKSWTQEPLPDAVLHDGPLGGPSDLMGIAFAGGQAIVAAWNHVLVNDGSGWQVDPGAQALLDQVDGARIYAVAGLPDGGAVAAGLGVVLERDAAGAPWHYADQPLPDQAVSAVGAFREDGHVRALLSVVPGTTTWPVSDDYQLAPSDPGAPPPRPPAFQLPTMGTLVRQTATGWRDEEQAQFRAPGPDRARKPDPATAMLLDPTGRGWVVGGWTGRLDTLNNGTPDAGSAQVAATGSIRRYAVSAPETAPAEQAAPVPTPAGPVRFLAGGDATCAAPCAGLDALQTMPERTLAQAVAQAGGLAAQPGGPKALLYTGGRVPPAADETPEPQAEADRLAQLLGGAGNALPVLPAVAPGDVSGGTSSAWLKAFGRDSTHYTADVSGVRVVVIDNAAGSLAAADPQQAAWLTATLEDAKAKHLPALVVGNRSLDPADPNAASDAGDVAALLRDHGASAYIYDLAGKQRSGAIPAGGGDTIPSLGTGTLGYRDAGDEQLAFGIPGLLLLEVDPTKIDNKGRAPVAVRLIPVIEDLALQAVDGRVLNRSRPALFRGLGRRPRSGDVKRQTAGGSDPYVQLPSPTCARTGCAGRLNPEVTFTSSKPDVADFVRQDPSSDNPRKPYLDPKTDKVVPDPTSALLCAFNAGTTTVSVSAGGLTYATTITVRAGSVLRPCGTTKLSDPPKQQAVAAASPPPPAPAPAGASPAPSPAPVPPPPPPAVHVTPPAPHPAPPPAAPLAAVAPVPPAPQPQPLPPASPGRPLPPGGISPPGAPSGVVQPATKVEKQREEEVAPEQQQSAVRYVPGDGNVVPPGAALLLILAAGLAGAGARHRFGPRRDRGDELALSYARSTPSTTRRGAVRR